ncbi:PLP-dependent aminotransferase family protein [Dialister pneumosintes]|jgi:Transcriptional regulators containing a DNA-binding HTH domain and an aminotransferase domain (MocR family) and their eukaryotic orthologs|uniref:GntR family transcriptional regulator n=1 Tax=Dialister pneumosintes TaxID=39950 RepID=A0A1B3WF34_9FIRM|nr:PLP-dependent aminotransferase family protein [Dialister pneumosintes]AOH39573.1 GntR family transcriptional regulator [Dialister pneumosintes]MBS6480620.1 PLP-dependent aminotransferase family protein [Dialister sp.]RID94531.1 PLP-dependent aminotransferase family protein [Dialister pneumosintes]CDF27218.1 putative uncharacterized protein [Dialister sp. CAG:588]
MKYKLDKHSDKPSYMQLYSAIKNDIIDGIFRLGDKLPSKRTMADNIGASVITVEHAYSMLDEEGYIEARQRSGYYVIYNEKETYRSEIKHILNVQKKGLEKAPEDFPFAKYAGTMRKIISQYGTKILSRSPNDGVPELQQAIANYLVKVRGIEALPQQIIIGAGAEYLYSLIVQMLGRDLRYALENPSYDKIRQVYEANGASCDSLDMGENGILSSELERTRASILHVTPFNSFPSGITATATKRAEYIRWVVRRNGLIVEDDYDSEFTLSRKVEDTLYLMAPEGYVIYVNSFAKTIAPSIRIAYMIIPKPLLSLYNERIGFYSCAVPVYEQLVLAEFINSGDFERRINKVRRQMRRAHAKGKK